MRRAPHGLATGLLLLGCGGSTGQPPSDLERLRIQCQASCERQDGCSLQRIRDDPGLRERFCSDASCDDLEPSDCEQSCTSLADADNWSARSDACVEEVTALFRCRAAISCEVQALDPGSPLPCARGRVDAACDDLGDL